MKRLQIVSLGVFLLLTSGVFQWLNGTEYKPNVLIILVDDLGCGDLSCLGAEDLQTPHIDKLFASGMQLNHFYANSTVCSPSRASLLTGCFPIKVGVPGVIRQNQSDTWGFLNPNALTLPEHFLNNGYKTALIGKWHLGLEHPNLPNNRGFGEFKGFLGDMMDDYWNHLRGGVNWMRHNHHVIEPTGHATDLFADWASDYLRGAKADKSPFLLLLSFNAPHDPVQPPNNFLEKVLQREPNISNRRAKLVAFIEHLDASIGRVLKTLSQNDQDKDTIIVFVSDNGGAFRFGANNGKTRGGKGDHYEGGIRVPMAVAWPKQIKAGSESQNIGLLMDLFPTLCALSGLPIPQSFDGISLMPMLLGKNQVTDERVLFWVRQEGNLRFGGQSYYAARYKDFKILQNSPWEPYQFFNLKEDPYEKSPLKPVGEDYAFLFFQLMEHIQVNSSFIYTRNNF